MTMTYREYKYAPMGWKGVIVNAAGKPYLWIASDGTWTAESAVNRGPFGGDQDAMLSWGRKEGFLCGEVQCPDCRHEWTAMCEDHAANGSLECPKCGACKGTVNP